MALLKQAESSLADVFKGAPPLSDSAKNSLVKAWPWIALVFGILQILAAWGLYGLTKTAERLSDIANIYSAYYTGTTVGLSSTDRMIIYLGLVVLLVDGVILLLAFSPLKARQSRGWDLLFLGALLNLVYGIIAVFINGRGVGSLIFSLIGSAIGFYLLFQVREKYHKA